MKLKRKGRRIVQRVPPDCSARSPTAKISVSQHRNDWNQAMNRLSFNPMTFRALLSRELGNLIPQQQENVFSLAPVRRAWVSLEGGLIPSWTEVWYGFKTGIKILLICRSMAKPKGRAIFPEISFLQIKKSSPSKILSYSSASYFLQGNSSKKDFHKPFYLLCKC